MTAQGEAPKEASQDAPEDQATAAGVPADAAAPASAAEAAAPGSPADTTKTSSSVDPLDGHPPDDLLAAARVAFGNAYVPYSGFHVGAALRTDAGEIYQGCNVENASYGLSRCAEQSAVQAMASAGGRHFRELVVYAAADHPASPCGACRQILFEFAPDATVYLVNHAGDRTITTVAELLPDGFSLTPPA